MACEYVEDDVGRRKLRRSDAIRKANVTWKAELQAT
jgi:hypothetical protein